MVEKGQIDYIAQFDKGVWVIAREMQRYTASSNRLTKDIIRATEVVQVEGGDITTFGKRIAHCVNRERKELKKIADRWEKVQPDFLEAVEWYSRERQADLNRFVTDEHDGGTIGTSLSEMASALSDLYNTLVTVRSRQLGMGITEAVDTIAVQYERLVKLILGLRRGLGTTG